MGRKKKIKIKEEIDDFDDEADGEYTDYDVHDLEDMVNEIIKKDPDDCITVDQLHIIVEWIKKLI